MGCWEAATKPGRKIRFALEKAGVQFIDDNDGGRGVRLKKRKRSKTTGEHD